MKEVRKLYDLGKLITADLEGCDRSFLNDLRKMKPLMLRAAKVAGAKVVSVDAHRFKPYGLSVTVIISESHIAIHSWPEHGAAAVDIFTCGDLKTREATEYVASQLKAENCKTRKQRRCTSKHYRKHKPT